MTDSAEERDPFGLNGVTIEAKYRVASVVGDGGFGVVYRGVHKGFGELIAIKCLKVPGDLEQSERENLLERLREEGRLLHRLSRVSSGIVQALDVGAVTSPNGSWVPFLVLEWLEGQTLGAFMREQFAAGTKFSIDEAIALLEPAARALAVAHEQKVAHRDVKPANLFITEVGGRQTMKVLDFGIAKVLAEHRTERSHFEVTGVTPSAFTPRYGAPEQFNKKRGASGPWTDVFALALILVEIVSGKKALDGDDPTQLYVAATDPQDRPTLRSRGVDAPQQVEDVLARAVEVDPRHRYRSVGDFWEALTAAAGVSGRMVSDPALVTPASQLIAPELRDSGGGTATRSEGLIAHGPTMPAESLKRDDAKHDEESGRRDAKTPGDRSTEPSPAQDDLDANASGTPAREPTRGVAARTAEPARPGIDPMEETPAGGAAPKAAAAPPAAPPPPAAQPSRGGSSWMWLSVLVLIAGGAFAYTTIFSNPNPGPRRPKHPLSADPIKSSDQDASTVAPTHSAPGPLPSLASANAPAPPPPEDMVRFEPTQFRMGRQGEIQVEITRPFFLDRYEVTARAYLECVADDRCEQADALVVDAIPDEVAKEDFIDTWKRRCNAPREAKDHPINCVSFADAQDYCSFRDRRLPTEAEWVLAARGTKARLYPWGTGEPSCKDACYDRNRSCMVVGEFVATCGGGSHPSDKTPEGVYDLAGNVAEWTGDGWGPLKAGVDPNRRASGSVTVRGGSFLDDEAALSGGQRQRVVSTTQHVDLGFRCAKDAPLAEEPPP